MLEAVRDAVWGVPTLIILAVSGAYFTHKCGLLSPRGLCRIFRRTVFSSGKDKGKGFSSLTALAVSLGGTVGVGSIGGVALAISVGGAGSIFWLWLCSLFGFGLKYAEVALAHSRRSFTDGVPTGGTMYALRSMGYGKLASLYAFLCVMAALFGGTVVQVQAVSELFSPFYGELTVAVFVAFAVALAVFGGRERIASVNTVLLPSLTVLFVFFSLATLICYADRLPYALSRIFCEAFGVRQAAGGVGAAAMIRIGCARGTFSTEAGMGSAAISYCAASETDSDVQGLWGALEVFIDSFVISTLTAFCIICTESNDAAVMFFPLFGSVGLIFYRIALTVFAFAAVISWCFYGEESLRYFTRRRGFIYAFRALAVTACFFGALISEGGAFALADIWGALMLYPNLFMLYKSRSDIFEMAEHGDKRGICVAVGEQGGLDG